MLDANDLSSRPNGAALEARDPGGPRPSRKSKRGCVTVWTAHTRQRAGRRAGTRVGRQQKYLFNIQ